MIPIETPGDDKGDRNAHAHRPAVAKFLTLASGRDRDDERSALDRERHGTRPVRARRRDHEHDQRHGEKEDDSVAERRGTLGGGLAAAGSEVLDGQDNLLRQGCMRET